ncbi:MAG: CD0519/CD1768 family membrane protein [Peptoanaerobacter stomatis]|uniref:CD0519/CD1768 family membrane protein n=1 Tax=Peptoanaerobacter stomatis TaxID=796937 RepID=UPI003F9F7BEC
MERVNEQVESESTKIALKKEIGIESIIFMICFFAFFIWVGSIMGGTNMIKTMMATAFDLLINVCLYLMAVAVIAGGISGVFSEFGVVALINKVLSFIMKPLYDLPGASSLGMLNCFMSDNPAILTLAHDDNFRQYFKKYQLPALTNLGTAFGMGLIISTTMMSFPVEGAIKAAFIGVLGATVGSVISVRLMIRKTKKYYGTTEMVKTNHIDKIPKGMRRVREGSAGSRFILALLDGGKIGVDMGMSIIPGVLLICTMVIILTNGTGASGVYDGTANQGIGVLPLLGEKLQFILTPLFGFKSPDAIAVPITALGSSGAAIGMIAKMVQSNKVSGNDIAVFTAICMCWSGYLSTHIAMMDALETKEMTGNAILSHTIGGLGAGIAAHLIWMIVG